MKKHGLWDHIWSLADRIKILIEKKWPGLSDSDMVTGGLNYKTDRGFVTC